MIEQKQLPEDLEDLIFDMTYELLNEYRVVQITSYIDNKFEESTDDFHYHGDTKPIPDLHWHFALEAALATT